MKRLLLLIFAVSTLSCDDAARGQPPVDYPPGYGALQIGLTSTDPISAEWVGRLTATQQDCEGECEPVIAELRFHADLAQDLVFVPPGRWRLELEVRGAADVLLYVGSAAEVEVRPSFVTSVRIGLTPAAGGIQISGEIDLGGERFLCGAPLLWPAHDTLVGLHGAQRLDADGAMRFHLFADEGARVQIATSDRPDGPWLDWQPTDLSCGAGRLDDVAVGLGGLLAVCHDAERQTLRLLRSEDGRAWTSFGHLDYEPREGDAIRSCSLVVDDQLNLFCAAMDRDVRGHARTGLVHAASPDGATWTALPPYDPDANPDGHDVAFTALEADALTPGHGLLDVRVIYQAGVYLLWGTWWRDDGERVAVHARSTDRVSWRFAGPENVTGLKTPRSQAVFYDAPCWSSAEGRLWCDWAAPERGAATRPDRWLSVVHSVFSYSGDTASCGLDDRGGVWCWGDNQSGRLGVGDAVYRDQPTRVAHPDGHRWRSIGLFGYHACALDERDGLWCWGDNWEGQLGRPGGSPRSRPTRVAGDWASASVGSYHTCAIKLDGTLWCWGANDYRQVGVPGEPGPLPAPRQVGAESDWVAVGAFYYHSCALRRGGELWCWGRNSDGELGVPGVGDLTATPRRVEGLWSAVAAYSRHTCGLRIDGSARCWGRNESGALGDGTGVDRDAPAPFSGPPDTRWASLSCRHHGTQAVSRDGSLWRTGIYGDGTGDVQTLRPIRGPSGPTFAPAPAHHPVVFRDLDGRWTMLAGANDRAATLCAGLPLVDGARLRRPGLFEGETERVPWRLTRGGRVTIGVHDGEGGCDGVGDPFIEVLRDGERVAHDDDGGPGTCARIEVELEAGDYEIAVSTAGDQAPLLPYVFDVCVDGACGSVRLCAADDDCAAGERCVGGECVRPGQACLAPLRLELGQVVAGVTSGRSDFGGSCGLGGGPEAVYAFEAQGTGEVCITTAGSAYDTILYVRATCADPEAELACDDDDGPRGTSEVTLAVEAAATYFVFVDGFADRSGAYQLAATPGACP